MRYFECWLLGCRTEFITQFGDLRKPEIAEIEHSGLRVLSSHAFRTHEITYAYWQAITFIFNGRGLTKADIVVLQHHLLSIPTCVATSLTKECDSFMKSEYR
jgi:hypothetical protein